MVKNYTIEKKKLPLIPIRGISIFPNMVMHFDVGREKSINALEEAMVNDSYIFLAVQKEADIDIPIKKDFYDVGVVSKVKQMLKMPGDNIRVLVEGISRAKIVEMAQEEPYFEAIVNDYIYNSESIIFDEKIDAIMRLSNEIFEEYCSISPRISTDAAISAREIADPNRLADVILSYTYLKSAQKQELLEIFDSCDRLDNIINILSQEIKVLKLEETISERVKRQMNEFQKEYYLKEQIKAIQKELGEDDSVENEVEEYIEKIRKSKMTKEVKEKAVKEANRLLKISQASPETAIIRTYLDWLIGLPWNKKTKDNNDLIKARSFLEEDHFGLEDVKERVIEYLAVRQLNPNMKSPILCFVGPPGVGKTSIAKSIARALDRKFIRMSLGGMRDEAEIRGHRRTYVGAIPGRIISLISKVKVNNPVFLLDEIDKLSSDFRGDPAAALLEVLDPEQNNTFTDHYLEASFSLSNVMFVTTANSINTIPRPLLDRMEVIQISGYTDEEKEQIAKKYLLPKQLKEHGISEKNVKISLNTINEIIQKYTRESGVRNLERSIGSVIRKSAVKIVENNKKVVKVNKGNLKNFLGIPKYRFDTAYINDQVGIATGLAWTAVGGETLFIEVSLMKGEGKIQLTGQLGDVMKESAMAGISYIRANLDKLDIDEDFYKNQDIHIHVPEGAIPKDGPSAGITITSAVVSALSKMPIKSSIAMTGEITLRGRVLPIGGVKEKLLAAKRAGITKVLIPMDNKNEVTKISEKVLKTLEIVYVSNMDDVLNEVLVKVEK